MYRNASTGQRTRHSLNFLGDSRGEELSALFISLGGSAAVMTGLFGSSRTDLRVLVSIGHIEVRQALAHEQTLRRDS
jgi:hypothetical protein